MRNPSGLVKESTPMDFKFAIRNDNQATDAQERNYRLSVVIT